MIYLFNLIVGTGALTLPSAFADCGWLVSTIVITLICFTSYMTATFIIECMSIANALTKVSKRRLVKTDFMADIDVDDGSRQMVTGFLNENDPLLEEDAAQRLQESQTIAPRNSSQQTEDERRDLFELTQVIECGRLAKLFFNRKGATFFYVCLCIYLYGDITIYSVAISKSIRDVICAQPCQENATYALIQQPSTTNLPSRTIFDFLADKQEAACWPDSSGSQSQYTRNFIYRASVFAVLFGCGPFVFFNVQKTKYLQIFTSIYRWFAFLTMIILASVALATEKGKGNPRMSNIDGIPSLFGVSVYAFMCHHSIPSLITPIKNKANIYRMILIDYILILSFYLLLSLTGVFTFEHIKDVYTLNFLPDKCANSSSHTSPIESVPILQYILPVFPIFVLATNFPIIAITLTNNLRTLFSSISNTSGPRSFISRVIVPLIAITPPIILSIFLQDLEKIMGVVGSYSGLAIQWMIPALMVRYARKHVYSEKARGRNFLSSPFRSNLWTYLVIIWTTLCLVFITMDHLKNYF